MQNFRLSKKWSENSSLLPKVLVGGTCSANTSKFSGGYALGHPPQLASEPHRRWISKVFACGVLFCHFYAQNCTRNHSWWMNLKFFPAAGYFVNFCSKVHSLIHSWWMNFVTLYFRQKKAKLRKIFGMLRCEILNFSAPMTPGAGIPFNLKSR